MADAPKPRYPDPDPLATNPLLFAASWVIFAAWVVATYRKSAGTSVGKQQDRAVDGRWCAACGGETRIARRLETRGGERKLVSYVRCLFCDWRQQTLIVEYDGYGKREEERG